MEKTYTFKEVIERIEAGEEYVNTNKYLRLEKIAKSGNVIYFSGVFINNQSFCTHENQTFRLVEPKKLEQVYFVEHKQGGEQYSFLSDENLAVGDLVICDTKYGRTYGRVRDVKTLELSQETILAYKKCWKPKEEV